MMFSDDEIKDVQEGTFMRPGDEIISIREVCLDDKFDRRDLGFKSEQLSNPGRNDLDVARSPFRDGFFSENYEQQAQFAWTEEDGNIAALVSEPGFGTTGQTTFGKELEAALKNELKDGSNLSSCFSAIDLSRKSSSEPQVVSSTSTGSTGRSAVFVEKSKSTQACKVDKADPRTRFHFVKYLNRQGRTVKLWECGICSREFQHQYTLMRHLPTHTDERNFHCDSCGKSFRQLSTLSQHRAIHSAERPYSCEVCRKTFNRVSTLISHRKTHSDQKPYNCHLCPKGFHQKGNLRNHLFTHTNERPYRCNICDKGFNQQSNLVCHKNKAHVDERTGGNVTVTKDAARRKKTTPRVVQPVNDNNNQSDSTRPPVDQCEVTSSVGPYLPSMEGPSSSSWTPTPTSCWESPAAFDTDIWTVNGNGVIVEPIKTYHMGIAMAMQQTPFALLQPERGKPVLVKVVDTKLPGGKQMLVPATADDLRLGGKIVVNNDGDNNQYPPANEETNRAVQIRVPVVATVVPKINPGGRLQLSVAEPHHGYTALSADIGEIHVEPCTLRQSREIARENRNKSRPAVLRRLDSVTLPPPDVPSYPAIRSGPSMTSSCALSPPAPPPAPSPPLDLISMDLFEPMECIVPMGPQITAVGNMGHGPPSDDSDIFIGKFEESIALSDSD